MEWIAWIQTWGAICALLCLMKILSVGKKQLRAIAFIHSQEEFSHV